MEKHKRVIERRRRKKLIKRHGDKWNLHRNAWANPHHYSDDFFEYLTGKQKVKSEVSNEKK